MKHFFPDAESRFDFFPRREVNVFFSAVFFCRPKNTLNGPTQPVSPRLDQRFKIASKNEWSNAIELKYVIRTKLETLDLKKMIKLSKLFKNATISRFRQLRTHCRSKVMS